MIATCCILCPPKYHTQPHLCPSAQAMPSVLQQTSSSLRAPVQSPLKKSLLTTLSTLPLRITFPSAGFLNPFSLTLPKASLYCILQVPFLGSSQHLPPHPSRTGPAVCAPNSNGPTITLYTSASRNQLPPPVADLPPGGPPRPKDTQMWTFLGTRSSSDAPSPRALT